MTPRSDQFNESDELAQEVFIPFDEAGEARFPKRAPDVFDDTEASEDAE